MRVWFVDTQTEYHRTPLQQAAISSALKQAGVDVCASPEGADAALCMSFTAAQNAVRRFDVGRTVHYCWDVYPFQVYGHPDRTVRAWWAEYLSMLRSCAAVLVPSNAARQRVYEFCGVSARIVKCSAVPWHGRLTEPKHVLNVMRVYEDHNARALEHVCAKLGLPLVQPQCRLLRADFERAVLGARVLVSPYYEASTGGLTLLEGYWHGIPCLAAQSPRNGVVDYMGSRASYFVWDEWTGLEERLLAVWNRGRVVAPDHKEWVDREYSDAAFAQRVAEVLKHVRLK